MEPISIAENILKNYDIKPIIKIEKTQKGSGNTYYIETAKEKYVAKLNERRDFVFLYHKIVATLTKLNHVLSKIIRTKTGDLMTSEALVLYSFLSGETHDTLTTSQTGSALRYIKRFNSDLMNVPFTPSEIMEFNDWDKAKSLDFLVNHFRYNHFPLNEYNISLITKAIQILKENLTIFSGLPKQLIHSDLGADNFIFINDGTCSIIDFTPEYEHEIYSLCQFCYWNFYWLLQKNEKLIDDWLEFYYQRQLSKSEKELFNFYMVKAALSRIAGPLIAGKINLDKRFAILERVIANV